MTIQASRLLTNNGWIGRLPEPVRSSLLESATPETLAHRQVIHKAGEVSPAIYFPETAVFSMVVTMGDGRTVEANMIGREGYVPIVTGLTPLSNTAKTLVQVPGQALIVDAKRFASLVQEHRAIALLRERYLAAVFDVIMQSVGCNAVHSVRERCARWLLALSDRTESHDVNVIHQVLAETLGASRPRVTEILATLQNDGFLELQRATLRIVDFPGLRRAACECYAVIKAELANFAERQA